MTNSEAYQTIEIECSPVSGKTRGGIRSKGRKDRRRKWSNLLGGFSHVLFGTRTVGMRRRARGKGGFFCRSRGEE